MAGLGVGKECPVEVAAQIARLGSRPDWLDSAWNALVRPCRPARPSKIREAVSSCLACHPYQKDTCDEGREKIGSNPRLLHSSS